MRLVFKLVLLLFFALPLAIAAIIYLAIDTAPSVQRAAEITPANIERAKRILDQNDPRKLEPGTRRTVAVSQNDLDIAANYIARQYAAGGARVRLQRGVATIRVSLSAPMAPFGLYFNVDARLAEDGAWPRIAALRVGKVPVSPWLAHWLVPHLFAAAFNDADIRSFRNVIKEVTINADKLAVTYQWEAGLPDKLRTALLPAIDRARLRIYQERLAAISRSRTAHDVSLTELLVPLFSLAAERSTDDNAVAENRAVILLLTFYVNGQSIDRIVPDAKSWPRPEKHRVLLGQRDDFAKHFIVSAALAAKAGGPLADAVGVYKEIEDSRGGSGFSFNDIAADRAGTRFGEYAADPASAQHLQQRLSAGVNQKAIMPGTEDLPEFMSEAEFKRRFGGIDEPAYIKMMTDIEHRVTALPLYQ
jgi:hypothetical protein